MFQRPVFAKKIAKYEGRTKTDRQASAISKRVTWAWRRSVPSISVARNFCHTKVGAGRMKGGSSCQRTRASHSRTPTASTSTVNAGLRSLSLRERQVACRT